MTQTSGLILLQTSLKNMIFEVVELCSTTPQGEVKIMKQKIKVILGRTNYDGVTTSWQEFKTVEIEVNNSEMEKFPELQWHVVGEMRDEM